MKVPFVDLALQLDPLREEIRGAMDRVVNRNDFILGEDVALLEQEFAAFCGADYAVGCSSGTSALHLALLGCGIRPGDEVITTPHTFIATSEAISQVGAKVVFADIDEASQTISSQDIERVITARTRAIIVVHLYGQCADMDPILHLAKAHGLRVIEDAAQAHGASYHGRRVGTLGDAACFSFYPGKNLGAFGDAGMVVTNDAAMARHMRAYANHGRKDKYEHLIEGYNHRLDTLQAAVLRVKLPRLSAWNARRQAAASAYSDALRGTDLGLPCVREPEGHVYHLYVVRHPARDALRRHLDAQGIASGVHYPIPLHLQPAYAHLGYGRGAFPAAERAAAEVLSLPLFPEISDAQIEHVVRTVKQFA